MEAQHEAIAIDLRRGQGLTLPTVDPVGKVSMIDAASPLHGYQPGVCPGLLVVNAIDVFHSSRVPSTTSSYETVVTATRRSVAGIRRS